MMERAPYDLDAVHVAALAAIFICWLSYGPLLNWLGRGSLNGQLHVVRLRWMRKMQDTDREHRVFDAILIGQLTTSITFFGSGTLIVMAGLVGALAGVGGIHAALTRLEFFPSMSLGLFTIHFAALTLIMAVSFFSFAYAIRKLGYTLAMIGGLIETGTDEEHARIMIAQTATVLTAAVKSLNNGIRGFYFAVAALFLFVSPWVAIFVTLLITTVLIYRQGYSTEAIAIEKYVDAMNAHEEARMARGESAI
jgi:uncharacterized membrane protein